MKVIIYGMSAKVETVISWIKSDVEILCIVDKDKDKLGRKSKSGFEVKPISELSRNDYEFIVVSTINDKSIEEDLRKLRLLDKAIFFWRDYRSGSGETPFRNRILEGLKETEAYKWRLDSAPYEWGIKKIPYIRSSEELLKKMISDGSSLCRFGDGEFEIMLHRDRAWFQSQDTRLSDELRKIIRVNDKSINIAIAQDFLLDSYKEQYADDIRAYMYGGTRHEVMSLLSDSTEYYDAYVSRPYLIYNDRKNAQKIFKLFKKLWENRNVCVIEGIYNRLGCGNDLLSTAKNVTRISCPATNAWSKVDEIERVIIEKCSKDTLLLISLGPAAKVLAYRLALKGYQAIDIGQLDNEYDWYNMHAEERQSIRGKIAVEKFAGFDAIEKDDEIENQYNSQIVAEVKK